jgi:molybdopterin converting factor subunit 1
MQLDVMFFASYRELVGTDRLSVTVPPEATVGDLVSLIRARDETFARLPERPAVAVNHEVSRPERSLRTGDEIAFLPPVAGG